MELNFDHIANEFKKVQDHIVNSLIQAGSNPYHEDHWNYEKGSGGGRSRLWENPLQLQSDSQSTLSTEALFEKAGVNFSAIQGGTLPPSALAQMNLPKDTPYKATGVSLVLHAQNPHLPTIHLNVRYFECGDQWWFGGGVDLTPVYTQREDVVSFHRTLSDFCQSHNFDYTAAKEKCDEYFFLPHRNETRGVGGLFFDHLNNDKQHNFELCRDLGLLLPELYLPFVNQYAQKAFTPKEREFQKIRRGRYVEFNLLFDRGTHFGIQSGGRTESILMSLPAEVSWRYDWSPEPNSEEAKLSEYLKPQNWL